MIDSKGRFYDYVNSKRDNCGFYLYIPGNATNGDVIKSLFSDIEINNGNVKIYTAIPFGDYVGANIDAMKEWWNSSYKRGETDE